MNTADKKTLAKYLKIKALNGGTLNEKILEPFESHGSQTLGSSLKLIDGKDKRRFHSNRSTTLIGRVAAATRGEVMALFLELGSAIGSLNGQVISQGSFSVHEAQRLAQQHVKMSMKDNNTGSLSCNIRVPPSSPTYISTIHR